MSNSDTEHDDLSAMVRGMKSVASPFRAFLSDLHRTLTPVNEGRLTESIPEMSRPDPQAFAICVADTNGHFYEVGDSQQSFTLQALAHPFLYGLALNEHGRGEVLQRVGVARGDDNVMLGSSTMALPPNPLAATGALSLIGMIEGSSATDRLNRLLGFFRRLSNHDMMTDAAVFTAARTMGHRYRAMAYAMVDAGLLQENIEETLDLFFQQHSLLVNCRDLALMAATLANQGRNPVSADAVIAPEYVRDILSVLYSCGMPHTAGTWAYQVGLPAESSVSGALMAIVPQQLGIAVFSPLLNAQGHSLRGLKVCEALSQHFGLHLFDPQERRVKLNEALAVRQSSMPARLKNLQTPPSESGR